MDSSVAGLGATPRLPPGQYDTGAIWPVLTAEATPHLDVTMWSFSDRGARRTAHPLELGGDQRSSFVDLQRRHPLRDDVVETRHEFQRGLGRHAPRRVGPES